MSEGHWIKQNKVRKRFWPWAEEAGADHDEVHVALGDVESVADFEGTMDEAKALILAYVRGKAAGMNRTYGEMTEEMQAEESRLAGAVKGMPEAPLLAWCKFQSLNGFEYSISFRCGLQSDLAALALEQIRERIAQFEEMADCQQWLPLADPRNGIGARLQPKAKEQKAAPTSVHVDTSVTLPEQGQGGNGGVKAGVAALKAIAVDPDNKVLFYVDGFRWPFKDSRGPEVALRYIDAGLGLTDKNLVPGAKFESGPITEEDSEEIKIVKQMMAGLVVEWEKPDKYYNVVRVRRLNK